MLKKNIPTLIAKSALLSAIAFSLSGQIQGFAATSPPADAPVGTEWTDDTTGLKYVCKSVSGSNYKWSVADYTGSDANVVIPESIPNSGTGNYYVTGIEADAFSGSSGITSITLPTYFSSVSASSFNGLDDLTKLEGTGSNFQTSDGILYWKNSGAYKLLYVPKSISGDVTILSGSLGTMSGVNSPFDGITLDSITIPSSFTIKDEEGSSGYIYTFYGAKIGSYLGTNTNDGSLYSTDGLRLIAYGLNTSPTSAALSSITAANPYAFYSFSDLDSAAIPDAVRSKVPFITYASDFAIRHFSINGNTAYCYHMGKKNPQTVGAIQDYDASVDNAEAVKKITLLLFAGAPNDGLGIANDTFGDTDSETLKNATGSLVWEILNTSYTADVSDIYGIDEDGYDTADVTAYLNALRAFVNTGVYNGIDYNDDVTNNFALKFYPSASTDTQGLIVITNVYHPDIKLSYKIDKTWTLNYDPDTEISAYVRLYRKTASETDFSPVGAAVKLIMDTTSRSASYIWNDLDSKDAASGEAYEYKAYEVDKDNNDLIYDGAAYTDGEYTHYATFNYITNGATFVNHIDKAAPVELGSYVVNKKWDINYTIADTDTLKATIQLYRKITSDADYAPVGTAVEITATGATKEASYTWTNLDKTDAAGNAYEYKAYEMDPRDVSKIWDGSSYKVDRRTYSMSTAYGTNTATVVNKITKERSSGGGSSVSGSYSGWKGDEKVQQVIPDGTTENPEVIPTPEAPRVQPKTGDNLTGIIALLSLILGGCVLFTRRKRK